MRCVSLFTVLWKLEEHYFGNHPLQRSFSYLPTLSFQHSSSTTAFARTMTTATDSIGHAWESLPSRSSVPGTIVSSASLLPGKPTAPALASTDASVAWVQEIRTAQASGTPGKTWIPGTSLMIMSVAQGGEFVYSLANGSRVDAEGGSFPASYIHGTSAFSKPSGFVANANDGFRLYRVVDGVVKHVKNAFPGLVNLFDRNYEDDLKVYLQGNHILFFNPSRGGALPLHFVGFSLHPTDVDAAPTKAFEFVLSGSGEGVPAWVGGAGASVLVNDTHFFVILRPGSTDDGLPTRRVQVYSLATGALVTTKDLFLAPSFPNGYRVPILTNSHLAFIKENDDHVLITLLKNSDLSVVYADLKIEFPKVTKGGNPDPYANSDPQTGLNYAGVLASPDGSLLLYRRTNDMSVLDVATGKKWTVVVPSKYSFKKLETLVIVKKKDDLAFNFVEMQF
ncbi:hypothetical protein HDU96_001444 [Phlyctochytrium bullatum]|nr:hypothetical protein HDU96_001444 [Phlyctochytrium bullatum]